MQNPHAAPASDPVTQSSRTLAPGTNTSKRSGASGSYLLYRAWADGVARLKVAVVGGLVTPVAFRLAGLALTRV